MAHNNIVDKAGPKDQRVWTWEDRAFTAENEDLELLRDELNQVLEDLATPITPDLKYTIKRVHFQATPVNGPTIMYSVLVHYLIWTPE
jgi:hypothetical protein